MDNGMTLSDIAAVTNGNGFGGGNGLWLLIILFFLGGGNWNRGGDYGQYATAASQQEILFGQQFQNLDNKMDKLGNGIADLGYANLQNMNAMQTALGGSIVSESRGIQDKLCGLNTAIHAEGEQTRALIQQNKIETLQRINSLELNQAMCGVVRYPNQLTYNAGASPFCNCNCGCGSNI